MALNVPDLTVDGGETLVLMGANGTGKSTLLHTAALLRWPDAGDVWVDGERATRQSALPLRRRIAMVFQASLLFDLSVIANVASGPRFRGVGRRDAEARAIAWLDRFGVAHLRQRTPHTLSGGEAQRVSLARSFAVEPQLLLLDEPFAALDAPTRYALIPDLATQLRETGTAAIIVTHDRDEAIFLGDRLGVMVDGSIVQLGKPSEIVAHPATPDVAALLGKDRYALAPRVNRHSVDTA